MLLEITSTLSCCANMPVEAILRDLIGIRPADLRADWASGLGVGEAADHVGEPLVLVLEHVVGGLERSEDLHHPGHPADRLDVRLFEHALGDPRVRPRARPGETGGAWWR